MRAAASGLIRIPSRISRRNFIRKLALVIVVTLVCVSSQHAQNGTSAVAQPPRPKAIYTPRPVYRAEWAKQGLIGKGVVTARSGGLSPTA